MLSYQQATDQVDEAEALIQSFQKWVNEWEGECLSALTLKATMLHYGHQPDGHGGSISETSVFLEGMAGIEAAARNMITTYRMNVKKAYQMDDLEFGLQMREMEDADATFNASRGCV